MLLEDKGFSLLEVVVALAIMVGGFLAVLQLYSMSIRSVGFSEKYLKGTVLAQSKMAELELNDFDLDKDAGEFEYGDGYRWKVEISPYDSALNSEKENIQLSKVNLIVFWNEDGKEYSVNLNTIKLNGSIHPMIDQRLKKVFSGGRTINSPNDRDIDNDSGPSKENNPNHGSGSGQSCDPRICGSCSPTSRLPPKCPPGKTWIFSGGCH